MTTVDSDQVGRFDQKLAAQRLFPSLLEQLKSQLPQIQELATRRLVPYIVRDSQCQCTTRPATAPSMTHPARRVMPAKRTSGASEVAYGISSASARPVHMPMCEVAAEYEPPAPPHMSESRGALAGGGSRGGFVLACCWRQPNPRRAGFRRILNRSPTGEACPPGVPETPGVREEEGSKRNTNISFCGITALLLPQPNRGAIEW
jgi:hypothetical protein